MDLSKPTVLGVVLSAAVAVGSGLYVEWYSKTHFEEKVPDPEPPPPEPPSDGPDAVVDSGPKPPPPGPTGEAPPAPKSYIKASALTGARQIPVAIVADDASAHDVLDAFGVPLTQGVFTPSFYQHKLFDRMLGGDISDISQLKLPAQIERIVLLRMSEPRRGGDSRSPEATILTAMVEGAVIDVPNRTVKTVRFEAAGVAFDNDELLRASLRENIAPRLEPLRKGLQSTYILASDGGGTTP